MIQVEQYMDIKILKSEGLSIRAIAETSGLSRNTVRKVLRGRHELKVSTSDRSSKLDPFNDYIRKRYEEFQLSAVRIMQEIVPMGYEGSLSTLRRYLHELKPKRPQLNKATVRFETAPGKQAQADWAHCGRFPIGDGGHISIYAFIMVLGYSRMMFITFTSSMRMRELIQCHQDAFAFFGGWTQTILYDNMKQVKISRNEWNEQFVDFASHYGFAPKTHRAYRPRTKGKVERMVDYLRDNFLAGRTFANLDDLNAQARHWVDTIANVRIHSTTKEKPQNLFPAETLIPLQSIAPYHYLDPVRRIVSNESFVHFQGSRYSVPPSLVGSTVSVIGTGGIITVRSNDMIVAEHKQATLSGQCIVNKDHVAALWEITKEQTKLPETYRWNITFDAEVEQRSLASFEAVHS
jgi:transposase